MTPVETLAAFLFQDVPLADLPQVDAIFALGSYAPNVAHHSASLWREGKAPIVIVSGKGRDKIPAGYATEADFYADILGRDGVPADRIVLEADSTNTLENVLFGMKRLREAGIEPASLIIVGIPPLLRRARATFQRHFPTVRTYGSSYAVGPEWFTEARTQRMCAEIDRFREYAKKGDIVPVAIPPEVDAAVHALRNENPGH